MHNGKTYEKYFKGDFLAHSRHDHNNFVGISVHRKLDHKREHRRRRGVRENRRILSARTIVEPQQFWQSLI